MKILIIEDDEILSDTIKVCILGYDIAEDLFSLANPVGETIKLNGDNYVVIGVLEEQGTSMGTNACFCNRKN